MKKKISRILSILLSILMLLSPCAETYAAYPVAFSVSEKNGTVGTAYTATASEADVPASDADAAAAETEKSSPSDAPKKTGQKQLSARVGSTRIVMTFDADAFEETEGLRLSAWEIRNEKTVGQYVDVIENDREVEDLLRETHTEAAEDEVPLVTDIVLYDIKVYNAKGKELQPLKEVSVTFENIEEAVETEEENPSGLQVCHFEDKTTVEVLEAESKADGSLQVETEHFSVYAVTSMNMGYHLGPVEDPEWTEDVVEPEFYLLSSDGSGTAGTVSYSELTLGVAENPLLTSVLPSSYSSLDEIEFPELRDQGEEGCCWAFAAVCLAEACQISREKEDRYVDYSEMALAYFMTHHPVDPLGLTSGDGMALNPSVTKSYLDVGGNCYMATETFSGWIGVTEESDAPYGSEPETSVAYEDSAILKQSYFFDEDDTTSIKNHIMEYGAVSVAYYHNNDYEHKNSDTGEVYYYYPGSTGANHNVTIVGWDDSVSPANFSEYSSGRPSSSGAWLARNSWGDDWGKGGYFWISYQDKTANSFNGMIFTETDTWKYNYHYDGSSYPGIYQNTEGNDYAVANVFKAQQTAQTLDAVSLATYTSGIDYTLKIYTGGSAMTDPTDGSLVYSASGTMEYAGLNTVELSSPIALSVGQYFSVVFEIDGSEKTQIGASGNSSGSDSTFWSTNQTKACQSFLDEGDGWRDLNSEHASIRIHAYSKGYSGPTYKISYVLNGGKNASGNPTTYIPGTEISLDDLEDPTRSGYQFDGWYLDADFDENFTGIPEDAAQNYKLYAKWVANTFYVAYNANGGTGSMKKTTVTYGTAKALRTCTYKKTNFQFTGWNTKKDGSGTSYKDKQAVKTLTTVDGKTVTLYAQWKRTAYTITYILNGGTNSKSNPASYIAGTKKIILAAPTRTGYTFGGWYSDSAFTKKVTAIYKDSTGKKTLYAKWTVNKYSITFNANGGRGTMSSLKSRVYGKKYTLPKNKYTKTGYTFAGWNTKKDGSGTMYADASKVKNISSKNGATVTLYAQWGYRITYSLDGGTNHASNPSVQTAGVSFTLKTPTKTGYTFGGWYTNSKRTSGYKITKLNSTTLKKDIRLYAKWTLNKYKIAFNANGGTGSMSALTVSYGQKKTLTSNRFTRGGYVFTGWNTKKDGSGTAYKNAASVKNLSVKNGATVTLYAQWKCTFTAKAVLSSVNKVSFEANKLSYSVTGDCRGVEVWRKTESSGSWERLGTTTAKTAYTDKTAEAGVLYYYRVRPYAVISGSTLYSSYSSALSVRTAEEPDFQADIYSKEKEYLILHFVNYGSKTLKIGGTSARAKGIFYPYGTGGSAIENYMTDDEFSEILQAEISAEDSDIVYYAFYSKQSSYSEDDCVQEFCFEYDGCQYRWKTDVAGNIERE